MKRILFLLTAALLAAALPIFAQSAASGDIVVTAKAKNANPTLVFIVCQAPLSMEFSRQEYWNG